MAIPVLLFVVALGVRVAIAMLFADPAYPDALYYANLGRELAAGGGFSADYIWSFVEVGGALPDEAVLPVPSSAHWMPLAAVVQVPFIWLLGPTPVASALPSWLMAAATAPLTYVIARDAGMLTWQGAAAGLLVAVPAGLTAFMGQPDNFAPYMLLGALALWSCARGLRGHRGSFAAGGVVVGLAFLSRNDGVLLGVPFALAFLYDLVRAPRLTRIGWWPALACVAGFLLVTAPWLARQVDVFGSLSPSAAGGRILFITEYRELYSVSGEVTLDSFLAQGLPSLLQSRLEGLLQALLIFVVSPLLVLLAPFVVIGAWLRRRRPDFVPWLVYAVVLFAFTALVSAVHVPYGTFIHSAVALVPHAYLLAMLGITAVVAWIAARRSTWDAARASRNISFIVVGVIVAVSAAATLSTVRSWERERDGRAEVLATLAEVAEPGDVLMSPDAGAYQYHGDWAGIVTPDDPLPVVEEAARRYGVRWLALEGDHVTPALRPVLAGSLQPDWLSAPLLRLPPLETTGRVAGQDGGLLPRAALFAVCLEAGDERCLP